MKVLRYATQTRIKHHSYGILQRRKLQHTWLKFDDTRNVIWISQSLRSSPEHLLKSHFYRFCFPEVLSQDRIRSRQIPLANVLLSPAASNRRNTVARDLLPRNRNTSPVHVSVTGALESVSPGVFAVRNGGGSVPVRSFNASRYQSEQPRRQQPQITRCWTLREPLLRE